MRSKLLMFLIICLSLVPYFSCDFNGDLRDKADEPYPKVNRVIHSTVSNYIDLYFNREISFGLTPNVTLNNITKSSSITIDGTLGWNPSSFGTNSLCRIIVLDTIDLGDIVEISLIDFETIDGIALKTEDYPNPFQITW